MLRLEATLSEILLTHDAGVWGDDDPHNGVSVLRSTNMRNDGTIDFSNLAMRALPADKRQSKLLLPGDIILENSGGGPRQPVGRVCYFAGDHQDHVVGNFCRRLRANTEVVVPRFLFWKLFYAHASGETLRFQTQTTGIRNLQFQAYAKQPFALPALNEQHLIVEILDEVDRLRKLRRDADSKACRILPALFLKTFGDPVANPMRWEEKPLRDVIATVEAGWSALGEARQRGESEFGVLKVSAVTSGRFLAEEHKAVSEIPPGRVLVQPRRGDLLFSRANTRELVAASCVVEDDYPHLFLSDKLWRLTPRERQASTLYLKELFWRDSVRDQFRASSSGSSGSMLNISQDAMLRTVVPIPPYPLQAKFEAFSWGVMQNFSSARNAAARVEQLFELVLQRAFSGQLTAKWRKAHTKDLLAEMAQQARALNLPLPSVLETVT